MHRFFFAALSAVLLFFVASSARADKVAVLPFSSQKNVPRAELEQVRSWTREAVVAKGHTLPSEAEQTSADRAVIDGVADTSQEYRAAGRAASSQWTLTGHVERIDYPSARMPDGTEEAGYATYRVELIAYETESGRVESLAREVLPDEAPSDIGEMIAILVRPGGIGPNTELPWERLGPRRPKPKPKPAAPPPPPPPPPPPAAPPPPRPVYGAGNPFAIGASIGVTNAIARPERASGPSWGMPIGVALGYALADAAPGLELRGNFNSQVVGPKAITIAAGARYAFNIVRSLRLYVGPELLLGAHVAIGADKAARFLTQGSAFVAYGITDQIQVELAGDLAGAFGGSGSLGLGGGTARVHVRF